MLSVQPTILIVDDEQTNLQFLEQTLSQEGIVVHPVITPELALYSIQANLPDLILLDIMMPGMNGYEFCQRLKQDERTKDIPIIFLTALNTLDDKLRGLELAAADYIIKPFEAQEVLARVKTHLRTQRLQRQLRDENARFRALEGVTLDGIVIHDQGRILEVNQAFPQMVGAPRAEIIGRSLLEFLAPDWHELFMQHIRARDIALYEAEGLKAGRSRFPIEIYGCDMPWEGQTVRVTAIRDISQRRRLEAENLALRANLSTRDRFGDLVGASLAMRLVYERISAAAAADAPVIIYGETGTGKELAARTIFQMQTHHTQTLISVNCGGVTESLFESQFFGYKKGAFTDALRDTTGYFDCAQGGTLFLDEIAEFSLAMQAKLLRVLNDQTYMPVGAAAARTANVRIIASTNQNLRVLIAQNKMREDFFQRIHVIALEMPPLRRHKEDIPALLEAARRQFAVPGKPFPEFPPALIDRLMAYDWPGNVRELFNEVRRYNVTGEVELAGLVPAAPARGRDLLTPSAEHSFDEIMRRVEQEVLTEALARTRGNKTQAAALLRMPLITLRRKMTKYGLT